MKEGGEFVEEVGCFGRQGECGDEGEELFTEVGRFEDTGDEVNGGSKMSIEGVNESEFFELFEVGIYVSTVIV